MTNTGGFSSVHAYLTDLRRTLVERDVLADAGKDAKGRSVKDIQEEAAGPA